MLAAFILLVVLICASPIALLVDGNLTFGLSALIMGVATVPVAHQSAPADIKSLVALARLPLILGTIPALWMTIQILPLGYLGIANPIWQTSQQALGGPIAGSIAIDTGAALIGLIQYITAAAIVFVTMAVVLDRSRADGVLFALLVTTSLVCLADLLSRLGVLAQLDIDNPADVGTVRNLGALGVLLAVTATLRAFERWPSSQGVSISKLPLSVVGSITSVGICGSSLVMHWTGNLLLALVFALAILLAIACFRRFGEALWTVAAFAAMMIAVSVSIIWVEYGSRAFDLMLSFSDDQSLVGITSRMLSDAPWFGSGVGSFETLTHIYQQPGEELGTTTAPTAAANIAIELGRPMLWTAIVVVLVVITSVLRGAFQRGRDWFYPALGASCLIALLIRAFGDGKIFGEVVSIVAAAILGLALAQRSSRRTRQ